MSTDAASMERTLKQKSRTVTVDSTTHGKTYIEAKASESTAQPKSAAAKEDSTTIATTEQTSTMEEIQDSPTEKAQAQRNLNQPLQVSTEELRAEIEQKMREEEDEQKKHEVASDDTVKLYSK